MRTGHVGAEYVEYVMRHKRVGDDCLPEASVLKPSASGAIEIDDEDPVFVRAKLDMHLGDGRIREHDVRLGASPDRHPVPDGDPPFRRTARNRDTHASRFGFSHCTDNDSAATESPQREPSLRTCTARRRRG